MPAQPEAHEFEAAPLGGVERLLTFVGFVCAGAAGAGGWWVKQNLNELGGLAGIIAGGVVLGLVLANRRRVPDRYVLTTDAILVLRGDRELVQIPFADLYAVDRVEGPYLPHRYSLDPRALFADAFGWNGVYFSPAVSEHRLLGTNVRFAVVARGKEAWVLTPADPETFLRALQPRLCGKRPLRTARSPERMNPPG